MARGKKSTKRDEIVREIDKKYFGDEPKFDCPITDERDSRLVTAFAWYGRFYSHDDYQSWVVSYLQRCGRDDDAARFASLPPWTTTASMGAVARMLERGDVIPDGITSRFSSKVESLIASGPIDHSAIVGDSQARRRPPTRDVVAEFETHLDAFYDSGYTIPPPDFFAIIQSSWSIADARRLISHYEGLRDEVAAARVRRGRAVDPDLVEAYGRLKPKQLEAYHAFVTALVTAAESVVSNASAARRPPKPRARKSKPAEAIVARVRHLPAIPELRVTGIPPTSILGATQLWVYNSKYRKLTRYVAADDTGFGVSGTTILNYSEAESVSKTIRKPDQVVPTVVSAGKVALRGLMDGIATRPQVPNGRLNEDTILLRASR